jgi:mono/diheme cytochrome c family protein
VVRSIRALEEQLDVRAWYSLTRIFTYRVFTKEDAAVWRRPRSRKMSTRIHSYVMLAAVLSMSSAAGFAQSGEATYKAKCQMCHGATGLADSGAGKAMKVKPATDPDVKKMSEADMIAATKNGMGKMTAFKDKLSDVQIKDAVDYFRTFTK